MLGQTSPILTCWSTLLKLERRHSTCRSPQRRAKILMPHRVKPFMSPVDELSANMLQQSNNPVYRPYGARTIKGPTRNGPTSLPMCSSSQSRLRTRPGRPVSKHPPVYQAQAVMIKRWSSPFGKECRISQYAPRPLTPRSLGHIPLTSLGTILAKTWVPRPQTGRRSRDRAL